MKGLENKISSIAEAVLGATASLPVLMVEHGREGKGCGDQYVIAATDTEDDLEAALQVIKGFYEAKGWSTSLSFKGEGTVKSLRCDAPEGSNGDWDRYFVSDIPVSIDFRNWGW